MKVTRRRGRARLLLDPAEVQLLGSLFDELDALLAGENADDAVVARLFPAAYPGDEPASAEFRALTESALREERDERLTACRTDLAATPEDGVAVIELADADAGRRWMQVLNDLRLALGTRLGITEDDAPDLDPDAPDAQPRLVYHWLTAVQDGVVQALMR